MDEKIAALTICLVLMIPQDSLGQHTRTPFLMPETKTPLLEAPKPKQTHTVRNTFIANAVMFGSSFAEANAAAYGSAQCRAENIATVDALGNHLRFFGNIGGGQLHPYKHDLKITVPLDLGVSALSLLLHKKHHDTLAVILPISSASAQISSAALKYGAGCF
jgi:hypothetical protein